MERGHSHPGWSSERVLRDAQLYLAREDFVSFIRVVAPWFVVEYAHVAIARHLEALHRGEIDRLMIAMAPRTGKSVMTSELFPAYWLGHSPYDKIMAGGHTQELSQEFGGEVLNMVQSQSYQSIFPEVQLVPLRKASGRWAIQGPEPKRHGGYWAFGTLKRIAGRGFNLGILDDPTSEQEKDSDVLMDKVERWYGGGFYTRRQPERNAILITATRWRFDDLPGRLLEAAKNDSRKDQWVVLNVPALLDHKSAVLVTKLGSTDPVVAASPPPQPAKLDKEGNVVGKDGSFLPIRMPMKHLLASKANMSERDWDAQYMGRPLTDEGAILKKRYWRKWPEKKELKPVMTISFLDTAFEEDEESDASAATTWHIFESTDVGPQNREYQHYHALLAGAWNDRVDAADLLKQVKEHVVDVFKPDRIIVEKRASGIQLVQEMKRAGLPVRPWLPPGPPGARGKRPRAFAAQIVFEQGGIWYADRPWAQEVINQCMRFPFDQDDDLVDTVTMCCIYLRRHYWLGLPMDEEDEEEEKERLRREALRPGKRLYGSMDAQRPRGNSGNRKLYG